MQAASDHLLGWYDLRALDGEHRDFYVRQLWDGKGSADVDTMDPDRMKAYSKVCGSALAVAHARSGDPSMITGYVRDHATLHSALVEFAVAYADQNRRDYRAFIQAVRDGRVAVMSDI